jgi:hypothetical protein
MARPIAWLDRIPYILKALEGMEPDSFLRRREVQELFGISQSAAITLMKVIGTAIATDSPVPVVTRKQLLRYLQHSPAAMGALAELDRRRKLAAKLAAATEDTKLHRVKIPITRADDWCNIHDLPGVAIAAGELRVSFTSAVDCFRQLYRLCKAAGHDWATFERLCGDEAAALPPDRRETVQLGV